MDILDFLVQTKQLPNIYSNSYSILEILGIYSCEGLVSRRWNLLAVVRSMEVGPQKWAPAWTEEDIAGIENYWIEDYSLRQLAALNNWKNVQRFGLKLHADRQNCKISKNHTQ